MRILMISNNSEGFYNFKNEVITEFISPNAYLENNNIGKNHVTVCVPDDDRKNSFLDLGAKFIKVSMNRRGTNIKEDLKLLYNYYRIIKEENPDVVYTFTIKPNIYAGIVCQILRIPYFVNVTGLGSMIRNSNFLTPFIKRLYKLGVQAASNIYFENKSDLCYLNDNIYKNNKSVLMPGSGINFDRFTFKPYPVISKEINFLTIGRIMQDKGFSELLAAAQIIKSEYSNVNFIIAGEYDEVDNYKEKVDILNKKGIIKYLGFRNDIPSLLEKCNAVIHPSYHEGLSNVLLEAAATGRPVIASNVPGCKETFIDGVSGFGVESKNLESLVVGIKKFISLSYQEKVKMGLKSRRYIEKKFDRKIVISRYIRALEDIESDQ